MHNPTPRLGTAQALALAALLAFSPLAAFAQEDVAETVAKLHIDTTPITESSITDADRDHWSFAPIHRHSPPPTKQSTWLRTGIDAFILAKLDFAGRIMNDATEPPAQIERLYTIAFSRRPTTAEAARLEKFLTAQRDRLAAEARPRDQLALPINTPDSADPYAAAAFVDACLAVLNSNEYIYID